MLKRVLALALSVVMVLGCVTTASAAEGETPSAGSLTIIRDVKAFGEIVSAVKVNFTEPVDSIDGAKVIVTVTETEDDKTVEKEYEREIVKSSLSENKLEATFELVEGGFAMDPWNTVNYVGYEVQVGGLSITEVKEDISPDVNKFEELTYTTPEYNFRGEAKTTMDARAYTPDKEEYEAPEAGYPLVVWLHGGGEIGTDNRIQIAANDVPAWTEDETQDIFEGAYILAPQNHAGASAEATMSLIEQFIAEKKDIDINRVYVGGCSYGGIATWTMIRTYPNFFAAADPICCGPSGGLTAIEAKALAHLPIYMTVSTGDSSGIVSGMIQAYNDLSAAGNENVHIAMFEHSECEGQEKFIESTGGYIDHWSWVYVHANYDGKGSDPDGKHFIDTSKNGTYNDGAVTVKDGVLTYTYTANDTETSISLNGSSERPEDAGYPTIKEWIADQVNEPADTLTIIRDVKAFGEIVDGLKVDFLEPFEGSLDGVKVTVTVADDEEASGKKDYARDVVSAKLADDKMSATIELEEGGWMTDPWNSVGYLGYKVEIGDKVITRIVDDISPDVNKFVAKTYTTPEYNFRGQPKTTMDTRYFVPDKDAYKAPKAGYPLVVWLHGGGETGTDNRIQIAANDVPAWTEDETQDIFEGAYILAPQNHAGASAEATMSLIEQFIEEMGDIDVNRVYVGGCSYGGIATWTMIRTYPNFFAAAYPICCGPSGGLNATEVKALAHLPIYMTVSTGDSSGIVSGMIQAYNDLSAAGNENVHIALFEHSECAGQEKFIETNNRYIDHWSWVYVHANYDGKGSDPDGRHFIDTSKDGTYNDGAVTVKDGVLTYTYTANDAEKSISLNGSSERPEDTGYPTIKEWIADQVNEPADTLTIIRDVKAFGEIVDGIQVNFLEPFNGSLAGVKVTVTVADSNEASGKKEYPRTVVNAKLADDKMSATIELEEGGFSTDPWNTVGYLGYKVEIGGKVIDRVTADISPDVDKFVAKTYTVPEYQYQGAPKTTMDARYFVPDKDAYEKPEAGYPLVVWQHGGGESGTDNRKQVSANDVPAWTEDEAQDIFGGAYILAPQNHAGASVEATMDLIEQFVEEMGDIDTDRIYIGGCSYGGSATWAMIRTYPDYFAAAYPICRGPLPVLTDEEIESLAGLPIYITVAAGDNADRVYGLIEAYNQLKAAGNRNVHITLFDHSEFEGIEGFEEASGVGALDHWSWVYVHANYDAKGDDYDGKNFIDSSVDEVYEYSVGLTGAQGKVSSKLTVKGGVITYSYTNEGEETSIVLDGKNERPENAGYATIKEWIADQSKEPTDTLTIIRDVKDFGEIVDGVQVNFLEPFNGSLAGAKVTVTVADDNEAGGRKDYPRTVANATLADDKMSAIIELEEGGFAMDPWNSVGYLGYKVEIGDKVITKIVDDISPDVDKFEAITYTTPEYDFRGEPKDTMDARAYTPDKEKYEAPEDGYALVVWLHGGGEIGTDNRIQVAANNVPAWTEDETQDIFGGAYVLAPQNHAGASAEATMSVIEQFIEEKGDIDTNRIYVGGCSYGGIATWTMIRAYPDFFAAAYPICCGPSGGLTDEDIANLSDMPVYMTVSTGDSSGIVSGMIQAYNDLTAAKNANVHFAMFEHSEFEGQDKFVEANGVGRLDHWSWVYVHGNYDAKGEDYDGKNFVDSTVDGEHNDGKVVIKNGVLTYNYTANDEDVSISLNGRTEKPEDAGYATIKEWIADQNLQNRSAGTLTVVRDVKAFGEIVDGLEVELDEPLQAGVTAKDVKVFVTVNGEKMEREIAGLSVSNDKKAMTISLVEGGFATDAWNSVNYQGYEVQVGGKIVSKVAGDISPDVDKFDAVTYTVPEYQYAGAPKTTMDARYFVPDRIAYKKPEAGYPLVVWLHGGGETGTDNRIQLAANNVPAWTEDESQDIFGGAYVLAPQNHASAGTGAPAATKSLIDQFIKEMGDIDVNRVYVGGCSYGGMGTWQMLRNYPDFFAAAYPICGAVSGEGATGRLTDEEIKSLVNLPIYMTVASGDTINGFPYGMIDTYNRLKAAGSKNLHIAIFEHAEFEGQDGFVAAQGGKGNLDHWSWVYVHENYDAKGNDYDGRNFIDTTVDGTYNVEGVSAGASKASVVVKGGVLTYSYTSNGETLSVSLNGKTERPEDTGYETLKHWIAAQTKGQAEIKFNDVPAGEWYAEAVSYVAARGIMVGMREGIFEPHTKTSRAMLVAMLYRLEGSPAVSAAAFEDVPAGEWYNSSVSWAAQNKIVAGYSATKFGPNDNITREQMAVMLYNYASFKGIDVTASADLGAFPDAGSVSDWAEKAIKWAVAEKLMVGQETSAGTILDPQGESDRAQVAQLFMQFSENVLK